MSAFPSLPLFTDAYIADTAHLTNEEHGAYLRLLMFAWRSPECRLPDDDSRLARMLSLSAGKWAKLKVAVMAFWVLEGGFWTQKRLAKEHEFVTKKVEQKRANGKQGGRPKSLSDNDLAKANGSENKSETKAPTPTPINTPKVPKGTRDGEPPGFDRWYRGYDARDGTSSRGLTLKRYRSALAAGASEDDLEKAKQRYFAELRRTGKFKTQYVKRSEFFLSPDFWPDYLSSNGAQPTSASAQPQTELPDETWREFVRSWSRQNGRWPLGKQTPPPDDPNTKVPRHILSEFNIHPAHARAA